MMEWTLLGYMSGWYFVRCKCGVSKFVRKFDYEHQKSKMCASCSKRKAATRHGYKGTRIYRIWKGMRSRCNNPNSQDYKYYGGRGIKVCSRWNIFENFLEDMLSTYHDNLTIERINVNGNYELSNCCWITRQEQSSNRRNTIKL